MIYGYDANPVLSCAEGGRLNMAVADAGTVGRDTYAYTSGTNRLASLTTAAGTRRVSYDGRGNTASETRPGSVTVTTGYDGYARLTSYVRSGGQSLAFDYNGLDDRVTMVLGSDTRHFVYDAGGRVLGEYGTSASDVKAEFIWLSPEVGAGGSFGGGDGLGGYMPLAVATPDLLGAVQVNWVHGNHLGVPLVITDSGGTTATTPNDYLAPGFPGQSKVLADLFYNRYRDYDPVTGRYVQADPIGLGGGSNSYAYVEGNPANFIDPDGLNPFAAGIVAARLYCMRFPLQCATAIAAVGTAIGNAIKHIPTADPIITPLPPVVMPPPLQMSPPRPDWKPAPWVPSQPKNDDPRDCCHEKCAAANVGLGNWDSSSRYRRCMRECLKEFGIEDY